MAFKCMTSSLGTMGKTKTSFLGVKTCRIEMKLFTLVEDHYLYNIYSGFLKILKIWDFVIIFLKKVIFWYFNLKYLIKPWTMWRIERKPPGWVATRQCTGGVSIQLVGRLSHQLSGLPNQLCAPPHQFVRFDRFLASKRSFSTAGSQNYRIRRHFCI